MGKTATAAQQAREATRQWRARKAAEQAAQDGRISDAVKQLLEAQGKVELSAESLAVAQAAHDELAAASAAAIGHAVTALKAEGLSEADIAGLTGLAAADVRRAAKAAPAKASPSVAAAEPALSGAQ